MIKIPMNFKRVAAAFDEIPRVKSCDSSGSEHSADLSDLVNSFLERGTREERRGEDEFVDDGDDFDVDGDDEMGSNFESLDVLKSLFSYENDAVKRSIQEEVEKAHGEAGGCRSSSPEFKRRLMARLRNRGFDAGICKSKWERNGRCPAGSYEYIDIEASGVRYIIEIFFAGEFTIARPTGGYAALLNVFPQIYVGRSEEVKQVVRVMCNAIRRSMKKAGIHVPPWRRRTYMQSKWFASYKRTTSEIPSSGTQMQSVVVPSFRCRVDLAAPGGGVRMGNLAAVLKREKMIIS
ncbi:hypothetical protein C2S51_036875 [Perilla frutescens var. frutescens]|nr:hypothetical protein C2S51_036875 [Perilla frutescens var. frutescens]